MAGIKDMAKAAGDIIGAGEYNEKNIFAALRFRGVVFFIRHKERRSA
jgi:hypothetical protein